MLRVACKTRDIDLDAFQKDICSVFSKVSVDDLDGVTTVFDDTLRLLLNKYAPEQTRNITLRPHAPWFSDELRELKRVKRRCERKFQSTKLTIDKHIYYQACRNYNRLLEVSKSKYLNNKFSTSDMKQLFKLVDGMFSLKSAPILPTHDSLDHLVESFSDFFESKSPISDVLFLNNYSLGPNVGLRHRALPPSASLIASLLMVSRLSFSHQKVKVVLLIQYLLGC